MPSTVRDEPQPLPPGIGYAARPVAGQSRSPLSRVMLAGAAATVILIISFVIRNPDFLHRFTGAGFAVGDCAKVSQTFNGGNMDKTDCASASQLGDPVYEVVAVKDGKDAYCSGGGLDHLTFSNEPESKTYCLVMR